MPPPSEILPDNYARATFVVAARRKVSRLAPADCVDVTGRLWKVPFLMEGVLSGVVATMAPPVYSRDQNRVFLRRDEYESLYPNPPSP